MKKITEKNYSQFVSNMKGIGILSVVLGHCNMFFQPYVNMYHLAIFFFVVGYTYNYNKYENSLESLMGNRILTVMKPYIMYMFIFGLLHNTFVGMEIMPEGIVKYDLPQFIQSFFRYFVLEFEPLCGAAWFIAPWLFAIIFWGITVTTVTKWSRKSSFLKRQLIIIIISTVLGCIGLAMAQYKLIQGYRQEVSLLMMPVIAAGSLCKYYDNNRKLKLNGILFLILGGVMISVFLVTGKTISLSGAEVISPILFYPVTFAGIYCVLYLSKIAVKLNFLGELLGLFGRYSLDIMVVHLVFFKLLYWAYINIFHVIDASYGYEAFVFKNWVPCLIFGTGGPIVIRKIAEYIYKYISKLLIASEVEMDKRVDWIDAAKGYGIILVVLQHLGTGWLSSFILTFHMPLFFLLSGYVFKDKGETFVVFAAKKIKEIGGKYILLSIPLVFYTCILKGEWGSVLGAVIIQKRTFTLWFLACLFWTMILFWIIRHLAGKNDKKIIFISSGVACVGLLYYKVGGKPLPWNIDISMLAVLFYSAGYLGNKYQFAQGFNGLSKLTKFLTIPLFLLINILSTTVNNMISDTNLNMGGGTYGFFPVTLLGAFSGILMVVTFSSIVKPKLILKLGQSTLIIFAWHNTIMRPLVDKLLSNIGLFSEFPGMRILIMTIFICVLGLIINHILMHLRGIIIEKINI